MKIAIIGASGPIGYRITHEALSRGHQVTAIVHKPEDLRTENEFLIVTKGDILDIADITVKIKEHDALVVTDNMEEEPVTAYGFHADAAKAALAAASRAGIRRVINVSGTGNDMLAVDEPGYPADWRPGAAAQRESLEVYKKEKKLEWTFLSPALVIGPGERTGQYRSGTDSPVMDTQGESHISYEDYAVAVLDELENPRFVRQRFTVGY